MKNIHVIATDKPSRVILQTNDILRLSEIKFKGQIASGVTQNIYITSDEEIKEGDYGLSKLNEIIKFHSGYDYRYYKKIILTTDQDLIKDNVHAIDDEFLEWFCKNPSYEEVETEFFAKFSNDLYKIIIPKEELKPLFICKPETL